jgi:hypothetical protein
LMLTASLACVWLFRRKSRAQRRDFFAATSLNSRVIRFLDKISGPGYATSAKRLS